ncbi:STE3-domain-containing protein [Peniophora sp. CONT]|nr:STE3-domain-containing protein [Peniophora sp. CONT]
MAAVDPTYPLYPIACILSAVMLLLVLLTSFIRQSWNLGVAFLCFWLFFENLTAGINHVLWVDDAGIRLYVYCDIVSHLQIIAVVVKPMSTLIIIRRLYLITSLQSVELPDIVAKRRNLAIEWTLGLVIPMVVAGPIYYIVQDFRFVTAEGFGCYNTTDGSILSIFLIYSWSMLPPLVSIAVYYPRVVRILFRQSRDINHFLQSNDSVTRTNYFRILALASIDILLTLPIGIATIVLNITQALSLGPFPFYHGWTFNHEEWQPKSFLYTELVAIGTSTVAQFYFIEWTSLVLAFAIFGLFGVTSEARASYWRIIYTVGRWFGWKPTPRKARPPLGEIQFNERAMDLEIGSRPSYIDPDARMPGQAAGSEEQHTSRETESIPDVEIMGERHQGLSDVPHPGYRTQENKESYHEAPVDTPSAV